MGVTGFIVPRADRHQNEYVPACEERLAWLTGFTGSAGAAIVLTDRAVLFVDGRYTLAGARADRHGAVCGRASGRDAARRMDRAESLRRRRALRLRPLAAYRRRRREASPRHARAAGATLVRARRQSDRRDLDGPPCPAARPGHAARPELRRRGSRRASSRASAARSPSSRPTRWSSPIRTRSPGRSTSAAPTSRTRRCRSPSRSCRSEGRPSLYIDGRKLSNDVRDYLEELADVREPAALRPRPRQRSAQRKRTRAARPGDRSGRAGAPDHARGRQGRARRRSDHADEGGEERDRDRGRARRACARRRRDGALPRLVRPRGAARQADRDRRGGGAGNLPPRYRPAQGRLVPDHLGRRAERRDRALPRDAQDQPQDRAGRTVPDRFRRANIEDGTTDITRTVAVGEPSAEMRDRFTRVLKGHIAIARAVFPDGTTGAQLDPFARQFLWEAGLDFDHGTGHGVGSYLSVHEGPARISKLGTARAQARHDPVERARLLQDRRLRHPHREPGAGGRGAEGRRRREAAQRIRDADARADRPPADRRRR